MKAAQYLTSSKLVIENKTLLITFMAAAQAISDGIDPESLMQSDEVWNRYINHAHLILNQLSRGKMLTQLGATVEEWHTCQYCGSRYETLNSARLCSRAHIKPVNA
jgi:hypothetical protein